MNIESKPLTDIPLVAPTIRYKLITIVEGGKTRDFIITMHLLDRIKERAEYDISLSTLPNTLLASYYISSEDRPKTISHLFNDKYLKERAFYLWSKHNKLVFVMTEHRDTRVFNVLKTVYEATECAWLTKWQNKTAVKDRRKFCEVFNNDKIFK